MMRFGDAPACLLAEIPRLHVRVFLKALLRRLASTGHCLLPSGFAGARAVAARRDGGDPLVATYGAALPLALACLQDDFEACIAHLRFPLAHRHIAADADALKAGVAQFRRSRTPKSALSQKCLVSGSDNQYVALAQFRTLVAVLVGGHPDKRCGTASPAPIKAALG
jgi:hypothetical protein